MQRSPNSVQLAILALFTTYFVLCLREPPYELHAAIHVVPTWIAIGLLLASTQLFALSNSSFILLVGFLSLHVLGTRYVYSYVPYDEWSVNLFGVTVSELLNLDRNHYDRLVHFSYGVLVAPAAREVKVRLTNVAPGWSYVAAIEFVLASSLLFELAEWQGAVWIAPEFADSYLGQQGDMWDAQQDTALATIGAMISMSVVAAVQWVRYRSPG